MIEALIYLYHSNFSQALSLPTAVRWWNGVGSFLQGEVVQHRYYRHSRERGGIAGRKRVRKSRQRSTSSEVHARGLARSLGVLCKRITSDYARLSANRIAPACVYKTPSCRFSERANLRRTDSLSLSLSLSLYFSFSWPTSPDKRSSFCISPQNCINSLSVHRCFSRRESNRIVTRLD